MSGVNQVLVREKQRILVRGLLMCIYPKDFTEFGDFGEMDHVDKADFVDNTMDQVAQEENVPNEEAEQSQENNMYARWKDDTWMCVKSFAIRTSFATYNRRKCHK